MPEPAPADAVALQPHVAPALGKSNRISAGSGCSALLSCEGRHGSLSKSPLRWCQGRGGHPSLLAAATPCTRSPTKASGNCPTTPRSGQREGEQDGSIPSWHGPSSLQPGTSSPRETNLLLLAALPAKAGQGSVALPVPGTRALCRSGHGITESQNS